MVYLIIGYLVCSLLSFGIMFGYFEATDPIGGRIHSKLENAGVSVFVSLFGPLSLLCAFLLSGFAQDGLKFK